MSLVSCRLCTASPTGEPHWSVNAYEAETRLRYEIRSERVTFLPRISSRDNSCNSWRRFFILKKPFQNDMVFCHRANISSIFSSPHTPWWIRGSASLLIIYNFGHFVWHMLSMKSQNIRLIAAVGVLILYVGTLMIALLLKVWVWPMENNRHIKDVCFIVLAWLVAICVVYLVWEKLKLFNWVPFFV